MHLNEIMLKFYFDDFFYPLKKKKKIHCYVYNFFKIDILINVNETFREEINCSFNNFYK